MNIEKEIFKRNKIDQSKLIDYGFQKNGKTYEYSKNILNNTFRIDITVDEDNTIFGKIFEYATGEEYTNFRVSNMTGNFVSSIKNEFENLLTDIKEHCTEFIPFIFSQSNRITALIKDKYNNNPNFEWEKSPGFATFKNSITNKWYGIIMNIDKSKLDKKTNKEIEVIDIKLNPDKIQELLKLDGFYPAYHMNKTNWITIILDDTVSDKEIMDLIDESYTYSKK